MATALATLLSLPSVPLCGEPSPVQRLLRFERALGAGAPRVFVKRDDLLPFALGGNKVRKLQLLAAEASTAQADTLITCGAAQSNHARVTAAAGAVMGWRVVLVLSGQAPSEPTGNLRHDHLFGAEVRFVRDRADREAAVAAVCRSVEAGGGRPYVIPVGGLVPLGAAGMARAVGEIAVTELRPDVIVHASSSGGTQAGLVAGCALFGLSARVLGVSADEPSAALTARVSELLGGMASLLGCRPHTLAGPHAIEVDDNQVGEGYGRSTRASDEALTLVARTEGIVLDSVYTAKAMAGLIARARAGQFRHDQTVLFWQTGGPL